MIVAQGTDGLGASYAANPKFLPGANRRIPSQMFKNPRLYAYSPTLKALKAERPIGAPAYSNPGANAPASVANPSAAMTDASDPSDAFVGPPSPGDTVATPVIGDQATVPAPMTPDKPLVSKPVVFVAVAAAAGLGYYFFMRKRRKG